MNTKQLTNAIVAALDEAKASDINVFNIGKITSIADYMIIASGRSSRQVGALADRVIEVAKANDVKPIGVEGKREGEWALVDLDDIIVHIMQVETREYFQLEKLWNVNTSRTDVM